jgi:hypothetical protein
MGDGDRIPRRLFANADGRSACPNLYCDGELMPVQSGGVDVDGIPAFLPETICPRCNIRYVLADDMTDRELYLRIAWLRENPFEAE